MEFLQQIWELDLWLCREAALAEDRAEWDKDIFLLSLHIETAIPSTSQKWMKTAVAAIGAPQKVQHFVSSLFRSWVAKFAAQRGLVDLFVQESGVAQNVSASGCLRTISFDARGDGAVGRQSINFVHRGSRRRSGRSVGRRSWAFASASQAEVLRLGRLPWC